MKRLKLLLCFTLWAVSGGNVTAAEQRANTIEGAYLLVQDDGYQRILSFDRSGNVSQVSDQQPLIGFSSGQGTWRQNGPNEVVAKVIDFNFALGDNKPTGPASIIYRMTFSDPVSGKYQKVRGNYTGESYAVGQNPLDPDKPPIRKFGIGFKGQRITVD